MMFNSKKSITFVSANLSEHLLKYGPFVYRLGHQIFILERGVRFPYGLQI